MDTRTLQNNTKLPKTTQNIELARFYLRELFYIYISSIRFLEKEAGRHPYRVLIGFDWFRSVLGSFEGPLLHQSHHHHPHPTPTRAHPNPPAKKARHSPPQKVPNRKRKSSHTSTKVHTSTKSLHRKLDKIPKI